MSTKGREKRTLSKRSVIFLIHSDRRNCVFTCRILFCIDIRCLATLRNGMSLRLITTSYCGPATFMHASAWAKVCYGIFRDFLNWGGTPKSSIFMGFSLINHPFSGTLIYGNPHLSQLGEHAPELIRGPTWSSVAKLWPMARMIFSTAPLSSEHCDVQAIDMMMYTNQECSLPPIAAWSNLPLFPKELLCGKPNNKASPCFSEMACKSHPKPSPNGLCHWGYH